MKLHLQLLLVLLVLLALAPAVVAQEPSPAPPSIEVQVYGGGLVSFGSNGAGTAITPTARIEVESKVGDFRLAPTVRVLAALSALPGETVDALEVPALPDIGTFAETYKSIEFSLTIAQPLSERLKFRPYASAGFGSRLPGAPEPADKAPRWGDIGLEFGSTRGRLSVGIGPDQRLDTGADYVPCVHVAGIVSLWRNASGADVAFGGDAILGLDWTSRFPTIPVARHDVIRAGLFGGWGTKR